jgi:hypothetical protein
LNLITPNTVEQAGPLILKISSGVIAPSDKGTPALTSHSLEQEFDLKV